jgi:tyrosyl-tRNA synthetase
MHILDELKARGLIQDATDLDGLKKRMDEGPLTFYVGYDPTAASLHAGSLIGLSVMRRLQLAGHKAIGVVGGSTGMVGDPSGRDSERKLTSLATIEANLAGLRGQIERLLVPPVEVLNNHAWTQMGVMEFLRDVGKLITVNYMLAKESVRARLEDRDQGISYTEFSYMLLQAWDFAYLAKERGVELQCGGSDQWGNITTGIELARKSGFDKQLFGFTWPLLMTADGKKFGKSSAGQSLWLDPALTSPYQFYQYWINAEDADVRKYLCFFTFLSLAEIDELMARHDLDRGKRLAQQELAFLATTWLHGPEAAEHARAASAVIFGGLKDVGGLAAGVLELVIAEVPSSTRERASLEAGPELLDWLVETKLAESRGAAKRLVSGGGVSINGDKIADPARKLSAADVLPNGLLVLRAGKKNFHLVRVA